MTELKSANAEGVIRQKYLGSRGLIVFIALLSAFIPLSTDLYLPALPSMVDYFHSTLTMVNLTLILFFLTFATGSLIWGPLSDKLGRKPVLLAGLCIYLSASILCATAWSIELLIIYRIVQALGASAAFAVSSAIVKDVYTGRKRETMLAIVQSMVILSPAAAPVLGALILQITSWRGVFVALSVIGVATLLCALLFEETLLQKSVESVRKTIGKLGVVLKNKGFTLLLLTFSIPSIAFMAFISMSTYIYQDTFGLSSQFYSYFFALNAVGMFFGPMLYIVLTRRLKRRHVIVACFATMAVFGALVCLFGITGPWQFALLLLPATLGTCIVRPGGAYLMLDQQKGEAGASSALMGSGSTFMGIISMTFASLGWNNYIFLVGLMNVIAGVVCFVLWLAVYPKPYIRKFEEPEREKKPSRV
jgi:MFS transporter, DHA1 family, multidrug resistance protein